LLDERLAHRCGTDENPATGGQRRPVRVNEYEELTYVELTASGGVGGLKFDLVSGPAGDGPEVASQQELAAVSPERTGWFRFYFDDHRWVWSEQVQRLHGYEPGTVRPTTQLVLSHKHPEDRGEVAATIDDITHNRGVFSSRHRIIDTGGRVRWVVVIGDQFRNDDGAVIGTHGFYLDVTPVEQFRENMVTARVDEITHQRGPIEHVKGMLMLIYDVDEEVAFGLLKWLSQENNIKLRLLAEQLRTDLRAAAGGAILNRTVFDHALVNAHEHIPVKANLPVTAPT
jgi:PAS domain S-box-containing protein